MKRLVIGMTAHVDSGKTTLAEALLYTSGTVRRLGRVDHGDAFLDTHSIEKKRGITVFSKQAVMELENAQFTLLDTPGHVDFSAEMERTLDVWAVARSGDLRPINAWLDEKVHRFGRLKKPQDILLYAMGEPLDATVYTAYLKEKYSALYGL